MPRTFDWMARPYALLEHLVLGRRLQRTRLALLPELLQARSILVLGEGDGRFLSALMAQNPQAQITVVERSAGMVERARRRLDAVGRRTSHRERMSLQPVSFLVQDARAWARTHHGSPFDAVVTLFFLDCFKLSEQLKLVQEITAHTTPHAAWLWADFVIPSRGPRRWLAWALVSALYGIFRLTTDIEARRLDDAREHFATHGWRTCKQRQFARGLLEARLFIRERTSPSA